MRIWLLLLCIMLLAGCTSKPQHRILGTLTFATIGDTVFVGSAFSLGARGSFKVKSLNGDLVLCKGTYRYMRPPKGTAKFHCSNGVEGKFQIDAERNWQGRGKGDSSAGPVNVLFGHSLHTANKRLKMPEGMKLADVGSDIILVDL